MSLFDPLNILVKVYQSEISGWWQYDNPNQILMEAILIQQTTSHNVEQAIKNLQAYHIFDQPYNQTWVRLQKLNKEQLEQALYPSGFYHVKAARLQSFAHWLAHYYYDLNLFKDATTIQLRQELNKIKGIGPETADVMILYVFKRPVFVPDKYCLRFYSTLNLLPPKITYLSAQKYFENQPDMTTDYQQAQQWHAALDEYGKNPQKLQKTRYKKIIPEK